MILIAPSILNADFANLQSECAKIASADVLHLDVMDGHFVPNLSFGPQTAKALSRCQALPVESHLMVEDPEKMIPWFAEGSKRIIVHAESTPHLHRVIATIKKAGLEAGVSLNPATPVEALEWVLPDLDLVLQMTVDAGFGGQKMIRETLPKIARLRRMINERGLRCLLEVDGGVNIETVADLVKAGADTLVVGSAAMQAPDPTAMLAEIRRLGEQAQKG